MTNFDNKNVKFVDGGTIFLTGADDVINVNTAAGLSTFMLPNIRNSGYDFNYKEYIINDIGNNAAVNPITIQTQNGDKANGQAALTISDNGATIIVKVAGTDQWAVDVNANTAPPTPSNGIWGIADGTGSYTYYNDLPSAISAVAIGGTIELFTSVFEFGQVVISKQLTINLNGNTYKNYTDTGGSIVISPGAGIYVNIFNGVIIKYGANSLISHTSGILNLSSTILISTIQQCYDGVNLGAIGDMQLRNATCYGANAGPVIRVDKGIVDSCYAQSLSATCVQPTNSIVRNTNAKSSGGSGFRCFSSTIYNCSGESNTNNGFYSDGSTLEKCVGKSETNYGIWIPSVANGSTLIDCEGYTNTSVGIYAQGTVASKTTLTNCTGYGLAGFGLYLTAGSHAYNCTGIGKGTFYGMTITIAAAGEITVANSTAITYTGEGCLLNHAGGGYRCVVMNNTFISYYDTATGAALAVLNHLNAAARTRFSNNSCMVVNAGAPIFRKIGGGTTQLAFVNNAFHGTTILSTGSFVQVSANTPDAQSNIFNNT